MQPNAHAIPIRERDKLRSEISKQVHDFLLSGGRIEVLGVQQDWHSDYPRFCHKPAAIDEFGLHGFSNE